MKIWQQNMPIYWILYHWNSCTELCSMPDTKEILSMKCFSENKWWWWLRESREEQRKRWKECGMTGRDRRGTGEEQDPTRWGAWEAVCSAAWLTHNRSATARAPPRVRRNRAQYAPTVSRQIHLLKMTGRNTQKDINTHRHTARKKGILWHVMSKSKVGEVCIYVSAAGKKS